MKDKVILKIILVTHDRGFYFMGSIKNNIKNAYSAFQPDMGS